MIKKLASLVLVFALLAGLMPMLTVPARAAGPDFTQTGQFTLRPTSTSGDGFYGAQVLPNGHIAAIVGQPGTYTLKIFDASDTILQTIPLNNLMKTRYDQTQIKIKALNNGNILIQYNKENINAVSKGPVAESVPNAYFLIVDESGQTILPQTQINSFSASSPQLTRNVSTVELSNGNLAFSWQRNDNISLATRVFKTDGSSLGGETVLVSDNASDSLAAAGSGVYMVLYNSGAATNSLYFKIFNNDGTFVTQKNLGNGKDTLLSLMALTDGNFLLGTYPFATRKSTMAIYDGNGNLQKTFTYNGYLGDGGAAVYKNADNPGFVTLSLDADAEKAINDAYNAGADFTGPRKVYLDYYDNSGTLVSTSAQSVDSGSVILKDYDKDSALYDREDYPAFSLFTGYQDSIGLTKIDYQASGAYSITGKIFNANSSSNTQTLFTVVNTNDSGVGSLRWAIAQAGAVSGGEVDFDPALAGQTITLQSDLTAYDAQSLESLTIGSASTNGFKLTGLKDAAGLPNLTVDGNGHMGIFATGTGVFAMSDIRMTGFDLIDSSGALDRFGSALNVGGSNYSQVLLSNMVFDGNAMTSVKASSIVAVAAQVNPFRVDVNRVSFVNNLLKTTTNDIATSSVLLYNLYADGTITNSLFANNENQSQSAGDTYGAAIAGLFDSHLDIGNNTFYGNKVGNTGSGDAYAPVALFIPSGPGKSTENIYNNLVIDNQINGISKTSWADLLFNFNGDAAINSGSNLLTGSPFVDAAGGNYRLSASAADAIDQGDDTKVAGSADLDGKTRINGSKVDIGAYEYVPVPATAVTLQSAVADGAAGTTTSTKIDLTFDVPITGLTASDITLTDVTGAAVKGVLTGSGTSWSIALSSVTTEGNISVAVNAPSGYTVSGSPKTVAVYKAPSTSPETTPAATIDYAAEKLTGLVPGASYTVNSANATADASGNLSIDPTWFGTTLSIVKKGNGSTTTDSSAQSLVVPSRPAAPTGVGKTDETSPNGNNGSITGVTSSMEYKLGSDTSWTAISGTTVTGLAPGSYDVRTKSTNAAFASAATSVTVGAFAASAEITPTATIDYAAEKLNGLVPNAAYTVNGTNATADSSGNLSIDPTWFGTTLSIVKKGNGSTTTDSSAQSLVIPSLPAAPTGVGKTNETSPNGNNGSITGVTSSMEYKLGSANSWTAISGTTVTGLAPGSYDVRTKSTNAAFASAAVSVTVGAFAASAEITPTATIDYAAEKLNGLVPNAAYTVNGTNATADASGNLNIDPTWFGTTLSIVKKGNGSTTTDSSAQSLAIPSRPAAPTGVGKTDETATGANDGTLTGVDATMEYKQGADGTWTDGTGVAIENLQPGTYYVRVKATASSFASSETSATIGAFAASPELTPTATVDYVFEMLIGLTPGAAYKINNQSVAADSNGNIAIEEAWLGTTLSIVKVGNGSATTDSSPQSLILPARPAAPTEVGKTDETSAGANNGTLTGVTAAMEYRQGSSGSWISGDGMTISGLAPGTYNVRVKALLNAFASAPVTLTIQAANPGTPAGGLTVTATDPSGAANDGKTRLAVTPTPSAGHTLAYIVFANGQVSTPNVGDTPIGYTALPSDALATAPDGSIVGVAELDAQGKVVHFGTATAIAKNEPPASGNNPGTGGNNPTTGGTTAPTNGTTPPPTSGSVIVLVNGKEENAGTAVTTTSGGVTTTAVTVDPAKIQDRLNAEGRGAIVTIPVALDSNVIVGKLNGQIVKNMENQDATLVLRTNKASYTLPAAQIDVDSLAQTLGSGANLQDIELQVSIGDPSAAMARTVNDSAAARNLTPLTAPLDFTLTAAYNGKTAEVSNFDTYVKRSVAMPAGIDPSRITTGIVVDPDGTVRHVPTKIVLIDGVYYAEINSLTNSAYSVVWHPLTFADVANHWAKDAVNDMGSRLVINGISDTRFDPNANITRAEFAAIIVRGLGLKLGSGDTGFSDIGSDAWYAGAAKTASAYGLITGFEDGTFRPDAEITREQATNIVAKAMKLTGLQAQVGAADADVLSRFADADQAGAWAKENMALAVKAGLITGRDGGKLEAKAQVTRAEVAVLIRRLLQNSDLID